MKKEITIDGIVYVPKENKKYKKIQLEENTFRVSSKGWKKIIVGDRNYLENKKKDIWEFIDNDEYYGEQLFTWDAAIRETKKAKKRMPTDEEFGMLEFKDFKNVKGTGYRYSGGTFGNLGSNEFLWSSSLSASNPWMRLLYSSHAHVTRYDGYSRVYGMSVRCVKE